MICIDNSINELDTLEEYTKEFFDKLSSNNSSSINLK